MNPYSEMVLSRSLVTRANLSVYDVRRAVDRSRKSTAYLEPMGPACHASDSRRPRVLGGRESRTHATPCGSASLSAVARPAESSGVRGADDAAHAGRDGAFAAVHVHVRDLGGQELSRRLRVNSAPRHPAVGPHSRLPLDHGRVLHVVGPRPRPWGGMGGGVRDLHG